MDWDEGKHQRAPKGGAGGGQFISYNAERRSGTGYGQRGGDSRVKRLQRALNSLGNRDSRGRRLDVDGMLGPLTTQAIKSAQQRLGIKITGRVTPELLRKLEDLAAKGKSAAPGKAADAWIRTAAKKRTTGKATTAKPKKAKKPKPAPRSLVITDDPLGRDWAHPGRDN